MLTIYPVEAKIKETSDNNLLCVGHFVDFARICRYLLEMVLHQNDGLAEARRIPC